MTAPSSSCTHSQQLRNGFIHWYAIKNPTLLRKCPEVPSLNGFPPPGAALAPRKIPQGPKQCLVRCQLVDLHSAQAKENTQQHLAQVAIARPSSCWVGHHWQVVRVTTLAWLQLSQASARGHKDKRQHVQLCHGSPFSKEPWPPRSPAGTADSESGLGK